MVDNSSIVEQTTDERNDYMECNLSVLEGS